MTPAKPSGTFQRLLPWELEGAPCLRCSKPTTRSYDKIKRKIVLICHECGCERFEGRPSRRNRREFT